MATKEILLTSEGKTKLEEELHYLETDKRAEVGERIKVAREFGDISENSEYDDAKNEQAWMESRIAEITQILANATVAETPKRGTKVTIGSCVTVQDSAGKERTYTVVGTAESEPGSGKISNESPLAPHLSGARRAITLPPRAPRAAR